MKFFKLLLVIPFFIVTSVLSQHKELKIVDSKTNQVIPFVNVVIKNTNIGWSGNENGVVKLNFTKIYLSDSLIFSAVGYEKITINYALINSISQIKLNKFFIKSKSILSNSFSTFSLGSITKTSSN